MRFLLACLLTLGVAACGDDDAPADGGSTADSGPADGGELDANVPDASGPSRLFGPCIMDSQCPGDGAFCRTASEDGFSGGQCTVPCEPPDRGPCDDGDIFNLCVEQADGTANCEERCLSGADCRREGYTCIGVGSFGGMYGFCTPVCSSDAECGGDSVCNRFTGRCLAAGMTPSGSDNGGTCSDDADCMSEQCIPERNAGGTPSGWNGGYCIGPCILPPGYNSNTFFAGETLPAGTCPEGDVCFPNGSLTRNDLGVCLEECTTNADCREAEGFECRKTYLTGRPPMVLENTFTNGVCLPIDCNTTACPTGFTCQMIRTTSGTDYVCARM